VVCWPVSRGHRFDDRHWHTSLKPECISRERHCAGKGICLVLVHGDRDFLVCIFVRPFNARSVLQSFSLKPCCCKALSNQPQLSLLFAVATEGVHCGLICAIVPRLRAGASVLRFE
jgi:hypothetical protein